MYSNDFVYDFDVPSQQSASDRQDEHQRFALPSFSTASTVAYPVSPMVSQSYITNSQQTSGGYASLPVATGSHDTQQSRSMNERDLQVGQPAFEVAPTSIGSTVGVRAQANEHQWNGLEGEPQPHFAQHRESRDITELIRQLQEQHFERFVNYIENRGLPIQNTTQLTFLHECGVCNRHYDTKAQLREHRRRVHRM